MANEAMMRRFIENPEQKLPPREKPAKRKARRKALRAESPKQSIRQAFLAGIRAERISNALTATGRAECARCPAHFVSFETAWRSLDLHHVMKRSRGHGYRSGDDFGVDYPGFLELVCRRCHDALESSPMWTGVAS